MNNTNINNKEIIGYIANCYQNDALRYYGLYKKLDNNNRDLYKIFSNFLNLYIAVECILKSIYFLTYDEKILNIHNLLNKDIKTHNIKDIIIYIKKNDDKLDLKKVLLKNNIIKEDFFCYISTINMNLRYEIDVILELRKIDNDNILNILSSENINELDNFYGYLCKLNHDLRLEKKYQFLGDKNLKKYIECYLSNK